MITPDFLTRIVKGTEDAVSRLNHNLIIRIAERISEAFKRGDDLFIPATIADMTKISQSGYSLAEVERMIEKEMPDIQREVKKAFYASANEISKYNDDFARMLSKEAGIDVDIPTHRTTGIPTSADKLNMTTREIRLLESAYKRTNGTIKNLTRTTASMAYSDYIQACDDAYIKVQAGMSPAQAISDSVDELAKRGLRCVEFAGRTDTIETAVARAVRTGVNQANSQIILQRCADLGVGYVKVSQHLGARVTKNDDFTNHSWWQGKIYKLDWEKAPLNEYNLGKKVYEPKYSWMDKLKQWLTGKDIYNYPDFVDTCGYGRIEGIIGINCRHTFQAWYPDINVNTDEPIDRKENEKRFRAEQKQRAMEREMRRTRREIEAQKAIDPQTEETKERIKFLKNLLKRQGERYLSYCNINRLSPAYDRTRIGGA